MAGRLDAFCLCLGDVDTRDLQHVFVNLGLLAGCSSSSPVHAAAKAG